MYNRKAEIIKILEESTTIENFIDNVNSIFGDMDEDSLDPIRIDITDVLLNSKTVGELFDNLEEIRRSSLYPLEEFDLALAVREDGLTEGKIYFWFRPKEFKNIQNCFLFLLPELNKRINFAFTKSRTLGDFLEVLDRLPKDAKIQFRSRRLFKTKDGRYKFKWVPTPRSYIKAEIRETDTYIDVRHTQSPSYSLSTGIRKLRPKDIPTL